MHRSFPFRPGARTRSPARDRRVARARGDRRARRYGRSRLRRDARALRGAARALAGVINLLDPEIIVLGGGLSNAARLYRDVPARWGRHVYSDTVVTQLVRAVYGDASGVRGAARLW